MRSKNFQNLVIGIIACISIIALIVACLAFNKSQQLKENYYSEIKIINVGLPRTGTTSFHKFCKLNNLKSIHAKGVQNDYGISGGPGLVDIKQFRKNGKGKIYNILQKYNAFSDIPYPVIIEELVKFYPDYKLIATTRDFNSWKRSMLKFARGCTKSCRGAGADVIPSYYLNKDTWNSEDLIKIYHKHMALLDKYNIEKIDLNLSNDEKVKKLRKFFPVNNSNYYHLNSDGTFEGHN